MTQEATPAVSSSRGHFFSDTHLFHPENGAADLHLQMLYATNAQHIFAVGDTFDFDALVDAMERSGTSLENIPDCFNRATALVKIPDLELHLRFVDVALWKAAQGLSVTFITGNHDIGLDLLDGLEMHGIKCRIETVYDTGHQRFLVEHGHMFDPAYFKEFSGIYRVGSFFLDIGLWTDRHIGRIIPALKRAYPVSNFFKRVAKSYVGGFIERAMEKARSRGMDGIVCGHIHKQDKRDREYCPVSGKAVCGTVSYINCGDGLTHGTSVIHESHGRKGRWLFLHPQDIPPRAATVLAPDNPFHMFRPRSLEFLQLAWKAHLTCLRDKAAKAASGDNSPVSTAAAA